jgi:hypothetical protein
MRKDEGHCKVATLVLVKDFALIPFCGRVGIKRLVRAGDRKANAALLESAMEPNMVMIIQEGEEKPFTIVDAYYDIIFGWRKFVVV